MFKSPKMPEPASPVSDTKTYSKVQSATSKRGRHLCTLPPFGEVDAKRKNHKHTFPSTLLRILQMSSVFL